MGLESGNEKVLAVAWHPLDKVLVAVAKSTLAFWTFDGLLLSKRIAVHEVSDQPLLPHAAGRVREERL